jgi:signal transduction histidine kinase
MAVGVDVDFRFLFENSPGVHLVLDPQFFIIAATDKYLRITMRRREDVVGQHLFDVFPDNPDDDRATGLRNLRHSLERVLRDRVADSMAVQRHDLRDSRGRFEERYWSSVNTPVLGANGQVRYIIHCLEDVTAFVHLQNAGAHQRKPTDAQGQGIAAMEAEILARSEELGTSNEQLKIANAELALRTAELNDSLHTMQTFTYTIAHDLRAPLRALTGFSSLLLQEYAPRLDDQGKDFVHHIRDAAQRMDRLVKDLLTYGRLTHVDVTLMPISLDHTVAKVLEDLNPEIRARNADVQIEGPLPSVVGNVALLNQVLMNLVDNALKFVPPDKTPRVRIGVRQVENNVRLYIEDNGIGIAPQYHAKIFDLFVRLHKPTAFTGTGIGLALVKKAMERMRGKVGVESTLGEGSCFWLEFPSAPYAS